MSIINDDLISDSRERLDPQFHAVAGLAFADQLTDMVAGTLFRYTFVDLLSLSAITAKSMKYSGELEDIMSMF